MMKIAFTNDIDEHVISKLRKSFEVEGLDIKMYCSEPGYLPDGSIAFYSSSKKDSFSSRRFAQRIATPW